MGGRVKKSAVRNVQFKRLSAEGAGKMRRMERLFLSNPAINKIISETGKFVLSCLVWPRFVAPHRWKLTRYPMPLAGVGKAFEGYRILQLTDLHVGKTSVDYLRGVVEKCLAEKPDLIVITGDLIDYKRRALGELARVLTALTGGWQPPDGMVAIFGNHDYHEYSWRHVGARSAHRSIHRRLCGLVEGAGIRILRNEQYVVRRGGERLTIVGMDEMWTGRADAAAAFAGLSVGDAVVCLQHNPDGIDFLKEKPWQWMLCGHSHGGQAVFPVVGALYVPMEHRELLRGFFRYPALAGGRERVMFVSTGLGYSTPIRMFCSPEATVFTVRGV